MTFLLPCMGGWCEKREHCANYHQGVPLTVGAPAERICEKGQDGFSPWAVVIPLQIAEPPQLHEEL